MTLPSLALPFYITIKKDKVYKLKRVCESMEKREGKKICLHCSNYVDLKRDHHVQLLTLNRVCKPDEHVYFHFPCWVDYFNQRVENKMRSNVRFMQDKAMQIFSNPMLKGLLSQVQGADTLFSMLGHPIADKVVSKSKVKEQIQNDRKKRSAKKRSSKMQ